jgi:hypothetical protein
MKTVRFFFLRRTAAVLLLGTSLARQADRPSQPMPSQSGEKSADQQKDQAHAKPVDETQEQLAAVTRTTAKHLSSARHSKPVPTYRGRQVKEPITNSPRMDEPGSLALPEQMGSRAATNVPNKASRPHSPAAPSSAVSVNGQQFRNSRDPGARLAASGGIATTARGTATINGTNMKHKP